MRSNSYAAVAATAFLAGGAPAHADIDATGAFTHSIGISLPTGVGIQPELALSYHSHAGNGLVGVGWDLDGFPVITRMNYGNGINYDAGDTFVGSGGRLVNFNATNTYRTEEESWSRYVPYGSSGAVWTGSGGCGNGPCSWKVTEPDGKVLEFGGTADSRIEAVGRGGAVRVWALSKVTDTAGNFYTVSYFEDTVNGDYRPTSVTYNQGNGRTTLYKVELSYEERADHAPEYWQSAPVDLDRRLHWITVKGGGQLIRKYHLEYDYGALTGQSRLIEVKEYGRDGTSTLPAQSFSWQEGESAWAGLAEVTGWGPNSGFGDADKYPTLSGDWNGDGKSDIARVHNWGIHFFTSTGTGWQSYAAGPEWSPSRGFTDGGKYPLFSGDWNGDGRTDIARVHNGGIAFAISTASGWQEIAGVSGWGPDSGFTDGNVYPLLIGDWNGDGKTDIGRVHNWGIHFLTSTGTGWQTYAAGPAWSLNNGFSNADRYPILIGDWNGDGKTDIGRVHNGGIAFQVSTGTGWRDFAGVSGWGPNDGFSGAGVYPLLIGDWNGDGKTDLGRVHNYGIHFLTSTGTGWQSYAAGPTWGLSTGFGDGSRYPIYTGDWNGDGKSDIARVHNNGVAFSTSTGAGWQDFAGYAHWGQNEGYINGNVYPAFAGDWTGEGKSGLGRVHNGGVTFITRAGSMPDLLVAARNGIGGTTSITYAPAPQVANAVRADLATCVGNLFAPSVCGNANPRPIPLATRVARSDGRNHTYSTRYEYYNARYVPGVPSVAENLGFSWIKAIDEQLQGWQLTTYRQDQPYHGRVSTVEKHAPGGQLLHRARLNYITIATANATRLIRTLKEDQEHFESGAFRYETRVAYEYDSYGNAVRTSQLNDLATPLDDVHTFTSYVNDTSSWRIGLVADTRICTGTYGSGVSDDETDPSWSRSGAVSCDSTLQRTVNYYDGLSQGQVGARGDLTRSSVWRSDTNSYLNTGYTYDLSGRALTRTNPAGTVTERSEYDAASGRRIRTENALGHVVAHEYDAASGEIIALTDPNGNRSTFAYDVFGRKTRTETPYNGSVKSVIEELQQFNPNQRRLTQYTDDGTIVTTSHLDGLSRVWKTTQTWNNGTLLQTDTHFDAAGREDKSCAPHLSTMPEDAASCTTRYYGAAGRVVRVDSPRSGGGVVSATTAYDGYRTTQTDAAGNVTVSNYDPATLTSTLTQPGGLVTATQKDVLGRPVRVTDPAGNIGTIAFNSLGWMLAANDPVTGLATYSYDVLGNLVAQTDAGGATTNMYYDVAARLVRTDFAPLDASSAGSEDTLLEYDYLASPGDIANGNGKLVRVHDRSGVTTFSYDVAGRVRTGTKAMDGAEYASTTAYDRAGRKVLVTYPDGSIANYRYDSAGHLSSITLDGVEVMRYENYNERGAPTSFTYGSTADTVTLTFEPSTGELLRQQDTRDFVNNAYAYDERGMLMRERDERMSKPNGDTSKAFAYDALAELVGAAMGSNASCTSTACVGSAWSKAYAYDQVGRVLQKDGKAFAYDANRRFQLARVTGEGADRTYDAVGRLLSRTDAAGVVDSYVNGSDGFLHAHVRGGSTLQRMTYDYLGNRVKKEILGAQPQTTWDIGQYKIVHDPATGKYYHTVYIVGLHGSRIAHRTVERASLMSVGVWEAYHDRALASLYAPASLGGFLPWAKHAVAATFKAALTDPRTTRGAAVIVAGLPALFGVVLAMLLALRLMAMHARAKQTGTPMSWRRGLWITPATACLCILVVSCSTQEDGDDPDTQSLIDSGRYNVAMLTRDGTNQPVPGTFYYLNSPLGSTSVMFDAQGMALLRLEYFPDGTLNQAASLGSYVAAHSFGQKEYDKELEAYYNAFRYYDAATMRFTTPDAIKESSDFLVHNIYAYTRNNPVNYTDTTGFSTMRHDGGGRVLKQSTYVAPPKVLPRPVNPVRTDRYNRGPDGGPRIPTIRRVVVPGRDYMPPDSIRGYGGASAYLNTPDSRRERELSDRVIQGMEYDRHLWDIKDGRVFRVLPGNQYVEASLSDIGPGDAIFVNGAFMSLGGSLSQAQRVRGNTGKETFLIYNASDGEWNDAKEWGWGNTGHKGPSGEVTLQALRQTGGKVDIYAHSQGAVITKAAIQSYQQDGGSVSGTWVTYGNAVPNGLPTDINQLHVVNYNDPITITLGITPVTAGDNVVWSGIGGGHTDYDFGSRYGH